MFSSMCKMRSKKGFTLAELLVVVAIIAVLVAIAIPVFGASQKKAEAAVKLANVRSAYAELLLKEVADGKTSGITISDADLATAASTTKVPVTVNDITVSGKTVTVGGSDGGSFTVHSDVTITDTTTP